MAAVTAAVVGVAGAAASYAAASKQSKAIKNANKAQPYSSTTTNTPWAPAVPYLNNALTEAQSLYDDPSLRQGPPGLRGMPNLGQYLSQSSYSNVPGASSRSRDIVGNIYDRAQSDTTADQALQQALQIGSGQGNQMVQGAYQGAQGLDNANLSRFISEGFDGKGAAGNQYLEQILQSLVPQVTEPQQRGFSGAYTIPGHGGGGGGAGGGNYDNAAVTDELKNVIAGDYLDEGNPHLQAVLENLRRENEKGLNSSLAGLDARAIGAGRYGGGAYQNINAMTRAENAQDLTGASAQLLGQNYESERSRMMEALGLYNSRDAAMWNDQTARAGIQASSSAAAAGAGASRYAADQQAGLERLALAIQASGGLSNADLSQRGLLGDAINSQVQNQQYGLGLMAQLGLGTGDQQVGALGQIPGLTQSGYYGLESALAGQQANDARNSSAAAANASNARAGAQAQYDDAWRRWTLQQDRRDQQWQWGVDRPRELFRDYLAAAGGIGSMGGTSSTSGTATPQQQVGPSPVAAGLMGGLGAALSVYGSGIGQGRQTQAGYQNYGAPQQSYGAPPPGVPSPYGNGPVGVF